MNAVDFSDVQGLARFGYGALREATYLLLRIRDAQAARAWLAGAPLSDAEYRKTPPATALQIAFTASGLSRLGVPDPMMAAFSAEFRNGMSGEAGRSRRLGDAGANDPRHWEWGAPDQAIDAIVMFFAKSDLAGWIRSVQNATWTAAFEVVQPLGTNDMGDTEPFGFRDGISDPLFDWERAQPATSTTVTYSNRVALGELLLGYPNEYGYCTDRPLLDPLQDAHDDLIPAEDQPGKKDFGRNGTYLVLRQLEQDVRGFWQYLHGAARGDTRERYSLGAAMVGRTLDGEPLIRASEPIDGVTDESGAPRNSFVYDGDSRGIECPFGAHIRRANPRNADLFGHPGPIGRIFRHLGIPRAGVQEDLVASTRFHRIARRGREYGVYLSPEDALKPAPPDDPRRGLQFACLCANIGRQFEFVQNAWISNTKFNGLTEESDPLLGNRVAVGDCPFSGNFSIPRDGKLPRRLTGMPQFVTVRGGAYFFMPSLRACRYLARGGFTASC